MHHYLKAIGFGKVFSKKELHYILKRVEEQFTHHELVYMEEEIDFCEYQKEFAPGIGISICGDMDINENFEKGYYFPFFFGTGITSYAEVLIERKIDREAYFGICEDIKIGISLVFYLQNTLEYLKERQMNAGKVNYKSVTLSGLCDSGTVLLPVKKDKIQEKKRQEETHNRMMLLTAAKNGDSAAMESLTLDDIDTYSKVSRRLITEDVFSIVDTYMMPYGVECDRYSILGEILALNTVINEYSNEQIYIMKLEVNELTFDVCVPVREVTGEPKVGRRFKADMWLQGRINF